MFQASGATNRKISSFAHTVLLYLRQHLFGDLSIKSKLILLFIIVSIIPILTIGITSVSVSSKAMLEKEIQDSINSLQFINYKVDEIVDEIHLRSLRISYSNFVRQYYEENTIVSEDKQNEIERETKIQLMSSFSSQKISSIMLINEDGQALYYSPNYYSSVQKQYLLEKVPPDKNEFYFFDLWQYAIWEGTEPVIPYTRIVTGYITGKATAYLTMNIKEGVFNQVYRDYESGRSIYYVINKNGTIQSCTDKKYFGKNISSVMDHSFDWTDGLSGNFVCNSLGENSIVTYYQSTQGDFCFIAITPTAEVNKGFFFILLLTIIIGLLCIAVCIFLGFMISRTITKPLYNLIDRISLSETKKDNSGSTSKNELVILSDKYGSILEHLEAAINQYYAEQQKKREAEIKALEFQINPHFLYNTLSTIIWLIEKNNKKDAIKIIKNLSAFFRISISKGREYIKIKEEIMHIDLYISILKIRYEDKIFIDYDIPKKLMGYYTPKLILQPLLENSIHHAMHEREDKIGRIKVAGRFDGDDIILEVWDNGDKVTEQTIQEMNGFLYNREFSGAGENYGIGISNVHDRLVMHFGDGYGLTFRRENNSTIASLRIKAITKGERE